MKFFLQSSIIQNHDYPVAQGGIKIATFVEHGFQRTLSMVSKKKILIIDDEVDFCFLLKSYFAGKDVDVQIANTLKEGKEKLRSNTPDIVFLDNNLPDGLGWEIADYIKHDFPSIEINLMSAYPIPEKGVNFNSFRLWEKPINITNLKNYVV